MLKFLKKGISAPIAIGIILVLAVLVGGFTIWQSSGLQKEFKEAEKEGISEGEPKKEFAEGVLGLSGEIISEEILAWENPIVFTKPERTKSTDIFDIFIKNEDSGQEVFLMRLNKVYAYHYHFAEYHNSNLYIIREFGYNPQTMTYNDDYYRELWRYDINGNGKKIFSAKSIDFRVGPEEEFIAIEDGKNLNIISLDDNEVKIKASVETLIHPDISGEFVINLESWSENGDSFWGSLAFTAYPAQFFKVKTENWNVIKYNVHSLPLNTKESSLNPNIEKLVYSDAPMVFDVDSAEAFRRSQKKVNLYLYDLNSAKKEIIDTTIANWFSPEWLDDDKVLYYKGGEKIIYELVTVNWKTYQFIVTDLKKGLSEVLQEEVEEKIEEQSLEGCSFEISYPPEWTAYTWPLYGAIVPAGLFIEENLQTHQGCSLQMSFNGNPEEEEYCFPISLSGGEECDEIFDQILSTFRFLD